MLDIRTPIPSDFPSHLTVVITHAIEQAPARPPPYPNILLLLHGLGDTAASYSSFARALNLPETTCITVQAPTSMPAGLDGFDWGDHFPFDPITGALVQDPCFTRASRVLLDDVVKGVLMFKCGYQPCEVLIMGTGQGGMVALAAARELSLGSALTPGRTLSPGESSFAAIISIGGPYPLSAGRPGSVSKNDTPVMLLSIPKMSTPIDDGTPSLVITDVGVQRTGEIFDSVEVHRWHSTGHGFEQIDATLRFLTRHMRRWQDMREEYQDHDRVLRLSAEFLYFMYPEDRTPEL